MLINHVNQQNTIQRILQVILSVFLSLLITTSSAQDWTQLGVDILGEHEADHSGGVVGISSDGNVVAVGAPLNSDGGWLAGHVRVFSWDGSSWLQMGDDIDGSSLDFPLQGDNLGSALCLNNMGNVIAIGAPTAYDTTNGTKPGSVRVYQYDGVEWTLIGNEIWGELGRKNNPHQFGASLALNEEGTVFIAGSPSFDGPLDYQGMVSVFMWTKGQWLQKGENVLGEAAFNLFGRSVCIDSAGRTIAIGAPGAYDSNGIKTGQVRVFQWQDTSWIQKGLNIVGTKENGSFGEAVSLNSDGSIVAIGGPGVSGDTGYVRIYEWIGTEWLLKGTEILGEEVGDKSGIAVSISGNGQRVAIGASYNNGFSNNAGQARVYAWEGTDWLQLGQDLDGKGLANYFGKALSLSKSGTRLSVGGDGNTNASGLKAGHVMVFENGLSGIGTEEYTITASVYPNPASQLLHVAFGTDFNPTTIILMNMTGQVVYQSAISPSSTVLTIPLDGLSKGLYLLHLLDKNTRSNTKVEIM